MIATARMVRLAKVRKLQKHISSYARTYWDGLGHRVNSSKFRAMMVSMRQFANCTIAKLRLRLVIGVVVSCLLVTPLYANMSLAGLFGPICISVYDASQNFQFEVRDDLAERVRQGVQAALDAANISRKVSAQPHCIKVNEIGFERQLPLELSIKRQTTGDGDNVQNVVVVGGVAANGLIRERSLIPIVIIRRGKVSDDELVEALIKFVDTSVVALLRQEDHN